MRILESDQHTKGERLDIKSWLSLRNANIGLALLLLYLMFNSDGMIGAKFAAWRTERANKAQILTAWSELADSSATLGSAGARVVAVVFSDYECPYCREINATLSVLLQEDPGVRVAWKHFPLKSHPFAYEASIAAVCAAHAQRFGSMHALLFTTQPWQDRPDWTALAVKSSVSDTLGFKSCLGSSRGANAVEGDLRLGERLHVRVTPTIFLISGERIDGTIPAEDLRFRLAAVAEPLR